MLPLRRIFRLNFPQTSLSTQSKKLSTSFQYNSKKYDSSDDEKPDKKSHKPQTETIKRLNLLLQTMVDEKDTLSSTKPVNIEIAKPKQRELKKKAIAKKPSEPEALANAAQQVAASFGGDVKQTETDLLTKLSSHSTKIAFEKEPSEKEESNLPKNELTPKKFTPTKPSISLNELIVGMKIDRSKKPAAEGRASQVRRVMREQPRGERRPWNEQAPDNRRDESRPWHERTPDNRRDERSRNMEEHRPRTSPISVNLFGNETLGIFHPKKSQDQTVSDAATQQADCLTTWQALQKRELRLAVTHPPSNHFEEMILWTESGKLWKFPIDNEQGLDEERKVYFAEHVFLEQHLESWCPRKGPVRHFMELVCVGLSKNPYITAKEKRDHIDWFREYFEAKKDILKETGAIDDVGAEKLSIAAQ